MTRKLLLLAAGLLIQLNMASAQQENVWAFGKSAGVDFNNGAPQAITTAFGGSASNEAAASVCDDNGQLLFYTEGTNVWNNTDTLMPNGTQLTPFSNATYSTSQGALIVPMPDSLGKYYIFSLTDLSHNGKLYYSVVDMSLDSGRGDIDTLRKSIYLDSNLTEKMTAVAGDQCNIWLLTVSRANEIRAYEITASGVNHTPVLSPGMGLGSGLSSEPMGGLSVSPNRKKLAATKMNYVSTPITVELYDFDPATGIASHPVPIVSDSACYSVCFSPDNSKLYVLNILSGINQFDISSGDSAKIRKTEANIGKAGFSHLKLGPDGKIYFFNPVTEAVAGLGCIGAPNNAGAACQYTTTAVPLATGTGKGFGLPNVVPVIKRDTVSLTDTVTGCASSSTLLNAADTTGWDYIWNNGTQGKSFTADTAGIYWLQYHTTPCTLHIDTFVVNKIDLAPVINIDEFKLSTTKSYDTYQWLLNGQIIPGATDSVYTVTENGDYSVVVSDQESGCTDTSATYPVSNANGIRHINAIAEKIKIYPNPATEAIYINAPVKVNAAISGMEGKIIKNIRDAQKINVADLAEGIYLIRITDQAGVLLKVEKWIKVK